MDSDQAMGLVYLALFLLFEFVRNLSTLHVIAIGTVVIAIVLILSLGQLARACAQQQEMLETLQRMDEREALQDTDEDELDALAGGWERS
jgi:hypothetical protein